MKERIKELRLAAGKTQAEFAESLGVSRGAVAIWETVDDRPPSSITISLMCDKYNINRQWLETGEGEMYRSLPRDKEIAAFFGSVLAVTGDVNTDRENELKKHILQLLARMTPRQWEALAEIAESWAKINENEGQD